MHGLSVLSDCFLSLYPVHLTRLQVTPAVNQIELHPNNPSPKLVAYNQSQGIHSTGYSCLGSTNSPLYREKTLIDLAAQKGKTLQQVLIMWGLQSGWSVIPKSVNKERIEKNFDIDGWALSAHEMGIVSSMKERFKVCDGSFLPDGVTVFFGDDE
jgi:glycerol 2-dehydrogenase (NADP+)